MTKHREAVGSGMSAEYRLRTELQHAEEKAWDALSRYKFMMFGYWAAMWVHLNRVGGFKEANPWKQLVLDARQRDA